MKQANNRAVIPASAAIIALNEGKRLPDCLASLSGFKEIVVIVDSKTTDDTAKVASDFGCRVYVEDWKGFGPQKQSAVDKCTYDYVFLLDADERLLEGSADVIGEAVKSRKAVAYSLRRKNYIKNRWIKHCGWWPDRVIRLFDRRQCRVEGLVHEKVVNSGETVRLDAVIEHYGFENYADIIDKMNKYTTISAKELYENNADVSAAAPVLHAIWMFFRSYIVHRGFMDGLDGLAVSSLNAAGAFFKYSKCREMKKNGQ